MKSILNSCIFLVRSRISVCIVLLLCTTSSCKKIIEEVIEPLDPFATPEIVVDNSLTAQSQAAANINAKKGEFLYEIPGPGSTRWVECPTSSVISILFMSKLPMIIGDENIVKDRKRVRKLTLCTTINANFYVKDEAFNNSIFNKYGSMRYFKIKADPYAKSPTCNMSGWITDPALIEGIGGVRIK